MSRSLPPAGRGRGRGQAAAPSVQQGLVGDNQDRSKAIFTRDSHGELVIVKPGEKTEAELKVENRTAEDEHYEAYLQGRSAGKIHEIGGYSDGIDRAAMADSASARDGERTGEPRKYAPSRAHNHGVKYKRQKGVTSEHAVAEAAAAAGSAMDQAMQRARAGSDDDDEMAALSMSAAQLASRAMDVYNVPISNLKQADCHGNDLRLPQLERKLRKFCEYFGEEVSVRTLDGDRPVLKDFEQVRHAPQASRPQVSRPKSRTPSLAPHSSPHVAPHSSPHVTPHSSLHITGIFLPHTCQTPCFPTYHRHVSLLC